MSEEKHDNNLQTDQESFVEKHTILLEIPPRLQWENDHGYCGETAIQSFGMFNRLVHALLKHNELQEMMEILFFFRLRYLLWCVDLSKTRT